MILILSGTKYDFNTEAFEFETVNDETVLYFKDIKKALVLNNTCSVIWKMIAELPIILWNASTCRMKCEKK